MTDAVESQGARPLLGQILKARGICRESQVQAALAEQRKHGGLIGQALVELGACTEGDLALALAEQAGLETVDVHGVTPDPEAIAAIDGSAAHAYGVLPLRIEGSALVVALADPMNTAVLEDLSFTTGYEARAVVADAGAIKDLVLRHYGEEATLSDAIADAAKASLGPDAESAAQSKPVVRLLNSILHRAIRDRASDVHFEVYEEVFRIRYRVDGSLYEVEAPPPHLSVPLVSRIKVMADLDITENRVPQDGRIELAIDGRPVDLRVATLPGASGEGCVMRVLDRSAVSLDLQALGLQPEDESALRAMTTLPHGIVLVTGPTGSGKTTTLYAMLSEANTPDIKIITVEDPVEYDIEGIVQVPINDEIGVDYAQVLRSILRQDPDKILVGEIRDFDTGATAVEASLTGHTVFATIHTNDAPSTVTRLVDMGVEPFLISATLEFVVAQRLVRSVCPHCRTTFEPDEDLLNELGPDADLVRGRTLSFGRGCEHCHHTGYLGRTGLFEIMTIDDEIRRLIEANASIEEIRAAAIAGGMRTLREAGLRAAAEGRTTVEEVLRETLV
ncbi:MAG: ATPase, T2SS/T4P/T4SS family [Planctomycetota bacterium]